MLYRAESLPRDMVCKIKTILIYVLVDIATAAIFNGSVLDNPNNLLEQNVNPIETRKFSAVKNNIRKKDHRSTSSSSGEKQKEAKKGKKENLSTIEISEDSSIIDTNEKIIQKKPTNKPKSRNEGTGWRKWHRKCPPCPEDMRLKWRDPKIRWICGAYQLARRTFKSPCMMRYRNCQDGTMFTKVADGRCKESTDTQKYGENFFYDYKASLSDDSHSKSTDLKSADLSPDVSSPESWQSDKYRIV